MMRPLMVGIMVVDYQYSTEKSECIGDRTGLRQQVQTHYLFTHSAKRVKRHVAYLLTKVGYLVSAFAP